MRKPDSVVPPRAATMAGRPVFDRLPSASTISGKIMSLFIVGSELPAKVPIADLRRDVTTLVNACLQLTARMLTGGDTAQPLAEVRADIMEWAREGVTIGAMHKAVRVGTQAVFDHLTARARLDEDHVAVIETAHMFVHLTRELSMAISQAYLREMRMADSAAADTVAAALIAGNATPAMARACGVRLAETYFVFAIQFMPPRSAGEPRPDRHILAHRTMRRVRAEVLHHCDDKALIQMGTDTATLLIPHDHFDPAGAERFVEQIADAAQTQVRATFVTAEAGGITAGVERTHAVLDIMRRLRRAGLERFDDLSLEYQLSRPGTAGRYLAALLDPLENHPVLLETLTAHLATRSTRLRTARALHVHPNTVDYRLNKIAEITGLDPTHPDGVWRLRSALVARATGAGEEESAAGGDPDQTAQAC
ncbi:PucR family transcriptional regulator [Nocardia sp. NPDC060249]|uniref:PucR family transcriptional regulator n=1 Tax=Nocardia sp. NPDC060249 TaxID=3347082 RepID=UPI00365B8483